MPKRRTNIIIRKSHRYLGIFLGIQFLFWTLSGLYFSWTDIDEIHGDQFRNTDTNPGAFTDLLSPSEIGSGLKINSLELRDVGGQPYYWINNSSLYDARTGNIHQEITRTEAIAVADRNMRSDLKIIDVERISSTGQHHEYRGRPVPAYVISYESMERIKAYVSAKDGSFQRVRHRAWRWFDFLWMTHTMDYEGRDNFNTALLRGFSVLGLITILSGFALWFVSSPTIMKLKK